MAEPLGRGLRPARYCGLTSPDPVSTVNGHRHTTPAPGPGTTDKPQNTRAAGKTRPETAHREKRP